MTAEAAPAATKVVVVVGDGARHVHDLLRALPERSGLSVIVACTSAVDGVGTVVRGHVKLERDHIYVVPPGREVKLDGHNLIVVGDGDHSIGDRLLRSAADTFARDCAAVLIDGRGKDCLLGLKRIKEAGGLTICEASGSETATAAVGSGIIDIVATRDEIPKRLVAFGQSRDDAAQLDAVERRGTDPVAEALRDIIALVRIRSGHDFTWYKRATIYRRISRRMEVCQTSTIGDYHRFLREHPGELANLLRDLLISVTNFFRDPDAFEALEKNVLPKLFAGKQPTDQVRAWVAGCATGEEAYSIAMLLVEYAMNLPEPPAVQVFATDIDEEALAEARAGLYPAAIAADVSKARLERFFTRENEHYRVTKALRELVLFSPHNVLRDPPFSRLDLISCRNMLIYLNRDAQDRVLNLFHFGLRPDGYLFLGSSESADNLSLQFQAADAAHRIYTRRTVQTSIGLDTLVRWPTPSVPPPAPIAFDRNTTTFGQLHHRIVEQYAPPSVLVNEELDIVHMSEHAGDFLTLTGGEPTRQLLRLAHPALRLELRSAIYAAKQSPERREQRTVRFDGDHGPRAVALRVHAADSPEYGRGLLLVIFEELKATPDASPSRPVDAKMEPVVREMEDELHRTRDQLRSTIEQYETSLEELKASNEELHAINEELRSASEELETSKEELQSVNEELTTLNFELKDKINEVTKTNSDIQNLMTTTEIGVVFLDRELRISRFTPRVVDVFNIIPADVGRPLEHVTHKLEAADLAASARSVLHDLRPIERQLRTRDGHYYQARFMPYRSLEDRIEGVVLTLVDVTHQHDAVEAQHRSEMKLRMVEDRLRLALFAAPIAIVALDNELHAVWGFAQGRELDPPTSVSIDLLAPGQAERFNAIAREVLTSRTGQRAELDLLVDGQLRTYDFRIEPAVAGGVNAVGFDITPSKLAEIALRDDDRRKDEFLATLSHELRNPLTPLRVAFDVAKLSTNNGEQLGKALSIMDRQLHVLMRLMDDLLDISRITEGKMALEIEAVDPVRVVELALDAVRPLISEAQQTLHVQLPTGRDLVKGDLTRLAQVVTNLLTNASRYTANGGTIWLDVTPDVARGRLRITVRDDGIGIDADLLPRVFEMYFQSRSALGRSQRGLGIGLHLVKRIVELHDGSVSARSDGPGRGSEFTVELPLESR